MTPQTAVQLRLVFDSNALKAVALCTGSAHRGVNLQSDPFGLELAHLCGNSAESSGMPPGAGDWMDLAPPQQMDVG